MNEIKRGTVGGSGFRRGVTGATYSRNRAAQPDQSGAAQPPQPPAQKRDEPKPNRYGGKCITCGVYVPENTGTIVRVQGVWKVQHVQPCPKQVVEQAMSKVVEARSEQQVQDAGRNVVNGETLYDGEYTLETSEGHRTFKLRTQAEDAEFMPGVQLIAFLSGPDNESDYKRFGHVKNGRLSVWKRFRDHSALVRDAEAFMADPHAALASATCFKCGRKLTVPASVNAGLGPECARRGR